jgi:ATP-dependent RNA helicase SUPV3L1/SUV3
MLILYLGLCAKEIHVCGDASAKNIIQRLCSATKDSLVVHEYKRLTDLKYLKEPLMSLTNVQKGDCFVCFNKSDIFDLARALSKLGHHVAIIYGSMPPGVKMEQSRRFNDPDDPCKILISTDAIGMGLNFNIKRIIFNSLIKPVHIEESSKITMDYISVSQALQISGRAGRFNSPFKTGEVTAFKKEDLDKLHKIIDQPLPHIAQAGLHPTADQVEMFSYHLPNYSLTHLLEIFITLSKLDASKYFMCMFEDIKYFAKLIEHIDDIPIRNRYIFVTAPINRKNSVVCSVYVKFIRLYSLNEPITAQTVCDIVNWPPKRLASNLNELTFYESIFDIFDLYLWLSMRFRDSFIDSETVKRMRHELDEFLSHSVRRMFSLTKKTSKGQVDSSVSVLLNDTFATKTTTTATRKLDEPKDLRTVSADFLTSSIITDILKSKKVKTNAADQIIDFLEKDE